jgi:hypothetical protein
MIFVAGVRDLTRVSKSVSAITRLIGVAVDTHVAAAALFTHGQW